MTDVPGGTWGLTDSGRAGRGRDPDGAKTDQGDNAGPGGQGGVTGSRDWDEDRGREDLGGTGGCEDIGGVRGKEESGRAEGVEG